MSFALVFATLLFAWSLSAEGRPTPEPTPHVCSPYKRYSDCQPRNRPYTCIGLIREQVLKNCTAHYRQCAEEDASAAESSCIPGCYCMEGLYEQPDGSCGLGKTCRPLIAQKVTAQQCSGKHQGLCGSSDFECVSVDGETDLCLLININLHQVILQVRHALHEYPYRSKCQKARHENRAKCRESASTESDRKNCKLINYPKCDRRSPFRYFHSLQCVGNFCQCVYEEGAIIQASAHCRGEPLKGRPFCDLRREHRIAPTVDTSESISCSTSIEGPEREVPLEEMQNSISQRP